MDANGGFAPLLGLPGATVWGDALELPFAPVRAAAKGGRAVVWSGSRVAVSPSLNAVRPQWKELTPVLEVERAWMSKDGTRALLAGRNPDTAQFISGIDGAARLSAPVELGAGWMSAAVSRDSDCALVGRAGSVTRICAGKPEALLYAAADLDPRSIVWLPGERQAAVVDGRGNRVLVLDVNTGAATAYGVNAPSFAEASLEGELLVASADQLLRLAPDQAPRAIALPGPAESLEMLPSGFLLAGAEGAWMLIDWREEQAYAVPSR